MINQDKVKQFDEQGYLVIENFVTESECDKLRIRCSELIENEDFSQHPTITFNTTNNAQASTNYFLTSGDKIRYFFEEGAVDKDGKLRVPISQSLNKIGHALHVLDQDFRNVTFSQNVKTITQALKMERPAVAQSMYIFKQPHFGGSVRPHQDSSFLYTTPDTLVGFWIALEDADIENGCLWFRPKSHKDILQRRMLRVNIEGNLATQFNKPDPYTLDGYIPCPVSKGTLVLIHGLVEHKSELNSSSRSRHIYTFHVYDSGKSHWSHDNWLQPTVPFPVLY